jgi:hypothetical protein
MELDGYCAALGIAFEHQGEHHYSTGGYFIDSEPDLSRRQEDDALKTMLCAQRGITLVSVPEIPNRLPTEQVRAFIKEQLSIKGVPLPPDFDTREVDFNKAYRTSGSEEILNRLRTIATERGGQCLSTSYVSAKMKLLFQCAQGHKWEAASGNIQTGYWCPFCAGNIRKTTEDMKAIAAARGGQCLSDEYVDSKTHLLWQCNEGHQWRAVPSSVKSGRWCPVCGHRRGGRRRKAP